MEDQSVSSTKDPFGFRRAHPGSVANKNERRFAFPTAPTAPSSQLFPPQSSPRAVPSEDYAWKTRSELTKDQRWTIETVNLTEDGNDGGVRSSSSSTLTTPTSNAAPPPPSWKENTSPRRSNGTLPIHSVRDMDLSHISPQGTLFSQLTSSPGGPETLPPAPPQAPRQSSLSTSQSHTRRSQQLTQQMMSQLQTNWQNTQNELARTLEEKDKALQQLDTCQSQAAHLQDAVEQWKLKYQQLIDQKTRSQTHEQSLTQGLAVKQNELEEWQRTLREEASSLQRQKQQVSRQESEWKALQHTIEEVEVAQQDEQGRLEQWEKQLTQQERTLEDARRQLESSKAQHVDSMRKQQLEMAEQNQHNQAQQSRLSGWERRLEEKSRALDERLAVATQQETSIHASEARIKLEQSRLEELGKELDAKRSQYEAEYVLTEQSLEELAAKAKAEQGRLDDAIRKRNDTIVQAERVASDSTRVRQAVRSKMEEGRLEYNRLQQEISDKREELEEVKTRIKVFLLEDRRSRQVSAKESQKADKQLDSLLSQIEVAQREKVITAKTVSDLRDEHEQLIYQIRDARESLQSTRTEAEKEAKRVDHLRSKAEASTKETLRKTTERLADMERQMKREFEDSGKELQERMDEVERLQDNLQEAAKKYDTDFSALRRKENESRKLQQELEDKLAKMNATEGRHRQIQDDLERELESVNSLLQSEREESRKKLESLRHSMGEQETKHHREVAQLAHRLETAEADREKARQEVDSLRAEIDIREGELALQLDSLSMEKSRLRQQLAATNERSNAQAQKDHTLLLREKSRLEDVLNTTRERLQKQVDEFGKERKSTHLELRRLGEELQKTRRRLEEFARRLKLDPVEMYTNGTSRPSHDGAIIADLLILIEARFTLFETATASNDRERAQLVAVKEEYESLLKENRTLQDNLAKEKQTLVAQQTAFESDCEAFIRRQQKAAIAKLVDRTWRNDQEAVSATFSKWVRTTIFDAEQEIGAQAEQKIASMEQEVSLLTSERDEALDGQRVAEAEMKAINDSKAKVEQALEEARERERQLRSDMEIVQADQTRIMDESRKHRNGGKNGRTLDRSFDRFLDVSNETKYSSVISQREEAVVRREAAVQSREASVLEKEQLFSEEYEDAQAHIQASLNDLRGREKVLESREAHLESELEKCTKTQARLQSLALQLHRKAELLSQDGFSQSRRVDETIDSQLQRWQEKPIEKSDLTKRS